MIHSQDDIDDVDKFAYLRRATTGPALDKIKVLTINSENYIRAWQLLNQTYSDERIIISRHINLLLDLPKQERESSTGMSKLVDETRQHREMLKSMGVDINEQMLVTILERKMYRATSDDWDETIKQGVFPKLESLLEFLARRAARLANRSNDKSLATHHHQHQAADRSGRKRTFAQAFTINRPATCPACKGTVHPLYHCNEYKKLVPEKRLKMIKDAGACFNCLKGKHLAIECFSPANCRMCGERHNTQLHAALTQGKMQTEEAGNNMNVAESAGTQD